MTGDSIYSHTIMTQVHKILCELNAKQKEMILKTIQEIGGETYHHITINPDKVIEAFQKQTPMKVEYYDEGDYAKCPNCDYQDFEYGINDWGCNFCSRCGQALDWSDAE